MDLNLKVDSMMSKKIFVVHGRNDKARDAIFQFIRSLGMTPFEWSNAMKEAQVGVSGYIGEIVDKAMKDVCAIIVLCTGDDETRLRQEFGGQGKFLYQARPNVLYEAGIALSRFSNRTTIVRIGDVIMPSDMAGRWEIRLGQLPNKEELIKFRTELKNAIELAGCQSVPGTDWLNAGDFTAAIVASDYEDELKKRYSEHVRWWTTGRPIKPNAQGKIKYLQKFGNAPVSAYMKNIDELILCKETSNAYDIMQDLQGRLLNYKDDSLPVAMVLDSSGKPKGIVTPTDLISKFDRWFFDHSATISDDIWFVHPLTCFEDDYCREAYRKMLKQGRPILTGLPVVERKTGKLVGFLPHHGGREGYEKD